MTFADSEIEPISGNLSGSLCCIATMKSILGLYVLLNQQNYKVNSWILVIGVNVKTV